MSNGLVDNQNYAIQVKDPRDSDKWFFMIGTALKTEKGDSALVTLKEAKELFFDMRIEYPYFWVRLISTTKVPNPQPFEVIEYFEPKKA